MVAPARLVLLAPNWLGDAVMALPLVADLQRAWPGTEIGVAARRSVAALFDMAPGIAKTIVLDSGHRWRLLPAVKHNAELLKAGAFDAALLLPNSFQSAWVAARAGIPERWGYARDLRGRLLTRTLPRPKADVHQAEYYQALAAGLGLTNGERYARLAVSDDNRQRAGALVAAAGIDDLAQCFVFAPGAAYGRAKQWPPQRFAELAALLVDRGHAVVLIGADADRAACHEVRSLVPAGARARVIDLAGRTDLTALAGLLAQAGAVVANDSGAMHLAAALGTPVVAIFGPTNDRQTSPLPAGPDAPRPIVLTASVWCRPCLLRECPIDHRCMTGITAHRVFDALREGSLREQGC